jgi:bifunctional UDP-N-acetylglucosamine pyrophosphorylase / glucosamine-1-phosphate N-acetyltransferase
MKQLDAVILAAGLGTRMKSSTIKILHRAAGRPLVDYVIDLATALTGRPPVLVVGHQQEAVREHCGDRARYAVQSEQLGTGHAVLQTKDLISDGAARILVLSGDVPLTREETLRSLVETHEREENAITLLSMRLGDPGRYGRVVRAADGSVDKIVEAKDASHAELALDEVNAGIYLFEAEQLFDGLGKISTDNAQGEYYLTDVIAMARAGGGRVGATVVPDEIETLGVNSRSELAAVEQELVHRIVGRLMTDGVTFRNPATVHLDWGVSIAPDTIVYPGAVLEGSTSIGRDCVIGPGVHLRDTRVGDGAEILAGSVAVEAEIGDGAHVGPYAHLRPGTVLGKNVKVGNFVETKKAVFGDGAKASHLSYIGDAEVGADTNIGAGTITCNYDGVRKHRTILEEGVFIGSDTQLVAPVRVGKGAYVGAGSTVTKDVPPGALALSRTPQKTIVDWVKNRKK